VVDRGMIGAATIAALETADIQSILGPRKRSTKQVRDEVDNGVGVPIAGWNQLWTQMPRDRLNRVDTGRYKWPG
jgi:hypothetical protein